MILGTSSRRGALVPTLIVIGALILMVAPVRRVASGIWDEITGHKTTIIGEGGATVVLPSGAKSMVARCTAGQILDDKRCGKVKIVIIDAAAMPFIARNIRLAWLEGKDYLLNKDRANRDRRYNEVCRKHFVVKYVGDGSCDEYPFASTQQGGHGARTEEVPLREQNCQGGTLSRAYQTRPITEGEQFLVVISHPDKIASDPFRGTDTAVDKSCLT